MNHNNIIWVALEGLEDFGVFLGGEGIEILWRGGRFGVK